MTWQKKTGSETSQRQGLSGKAYHTKKSSRPYMVTSKWGNGKSTMTTEYAELGNQKARAALLQIGGKEINATQSYGDWGGNWPHKKSWQRSTASLLGRHSVVQGGTLALPIKRGGNHYVGSPIAEKTADV